MPETKDKRLLELKSALKERVATMDAASNAIKVEDNGVVVSSETRDRFRAALREAKSIRGLIAELEEGAEIKSYLTGPTRQPITRSGGGGGQMIVESKSLGQRFVESTEFKNLKASGGANMVAPWEVEGEDLAGFEKKDVYTGLAPVASNRGFGKVERDPLVPRQHRTSRVRDLFPVQQTSANLIDFYRVSGFTNNAAPVAERVAGPAFGVKPQSSLTFTLGQAPVRTIAHWEAAHRNVLDDEPQLRGVIDNELMYGLRLEEDDQILNGDGTGENLTGILNTSGIQTYTPPGAGTLESKPDSMRRAATLAILAYYEPTGFVVHPYDWEDIELLKATDGQYIISVNVAIGAQSRIWRQPVVDTPAIPEGTFVTGAWGLGAQLYDRMQGNIRIAEQHGDFFIRNAVVILAEERIALAVKRPESFVKGTFDTTA